MSKQVLVSADEFGNVVHMSPNNPEYGFVIVKQHTHTISDNGWLRLSKRSALIKGLVTDLVAANFKADQPLPGRIIVKESLEPFNPENPDQHLKIAGTTGVVCNIDGQPIYRDTFYVNDADAHDVLIMHDEECSEAIRNAMKAEKVLADKFIKKSTNIEDFEREAVL
jgi:hypothetical protein